MKRLSKEEKSIRRRIGTAWNRYKEMRKQQNQSGFYMYEKLTKKKFEEIAREYIYRNNGSISGFVKEEIKAETPFFNKSKVNLITKKLLKEKTSKELGLRGKHKNDPAYLADLIRSGNFSARHNLISFNDIKEFLGIDENSPHSAYLLAEALYF